MTHNEDYRFGSAARADDDDLQRAGLFNKRGLQIGYSGNRSLHLDGDAPMITIGGAGSGKLRDLLAYVMCNSPGVPMQVLDPRGELAAISTAAHTRNREYAYSWNPMGIANLPKHRCNPLDILRLDSPNFHGDCQFIAESLMSSRGGGDDRYFILRARDWGDNILKSDVEQNGSTSFPSLGRIINSIESDPQSWGAFLEDMLVSRFESVRRTAGEMLAKQQEAPKEFGAVMGEIYGSLSFLNDPVLMDSLENPDFSLGDLCDPNRVHKIFLNVPAEYLSLWAPVLRVMFTVTMLYKARVPQGRRITLLVDEAGQMGKFEALLRAFTYGRGGGIRTWAIFQDVGQIIRNFGAPALQGFLGSAQMRQFFGVRDYDTAQLVSNMLGTETLEYDDELRQHEAEHMRRETALRVLQGEDPFGAAQEYAHYKYASEHRTKQSRPLMTPEEILAMPEDRQILFISGKDLKPIYGNKYPYFTRREMAGLYLPNHNHPPMDRVRIQTLFGKRWRKVINEPVPAHLASFPQHQSGTLSYVEGFKPF